MRFRTKSRVAVGAGILAFALAAVVGDAVAQTNKQTNKQNRPRPVVVVPYQPPPPASPYAPYYYSPWNPNSAYSIYDHLSGGRQQCQLPSEPCDNNHRVSN